MLMLGGNRGRVPYRGVGMGCSISCSPTAWCLKDGVVSSPLTEHSFFGSFV